MQTSKRRIKRPLECFLINGRHEYDQSQWPAEIHRHCSLKYVDNTGRPNMAQFIQQYRFKIRRFHSSALTLLHVIVAIGKINVDSAAGGGERLCSSIVAQLPFVMKMLVAQKLLERFSYSSTGRSGFGVENIVSWKLLLMHFIPKSRDKVSMAKQRGLTLQAVLRKLYISACMELGAAQATWQAFQHVLGWGLYKGGRVECVLLLIHSLLRKAYEWRASQRRLNLARRCTLQTNLVVGSGDVFSAFDEVHPAVLANAQEVIGWSPELILALLRENEGMELQPFCKKCHLSEGAFYAQYVTRWH
eukprot:gnl/MRDRNA2_/MRDRNA2_234628_c0_seq1.p1 gnl/MRDRNA2_/MRDRNA2_234628_c0~~gnl/MRDRNA2_/MRDRNA2_234628_c0_seq1.p1  ORF type:complete len:303 (+),score=39.29 gnl/MRDRNA2_/MRDRNA2_234628_c0_seq1:486-1394(+)